MVIALVRKLQLVKEPPRIAKERMEMLPLLLIGILIFFRPVFLGQQELAYGEIGVGTDQPFQLVFVQLFEGTRVAQSLV
jgi:hypothetical protein